MLWLRSLLFNAFFFGWTTLCVLLGLPALVSKNAVQALGGIWIRVTLAALRLIVGLDHRVSGREHIQAGPAIYAAKHQSTWDTLVFKTVLGRPAYVVKQELTWIPLFGWLLRRGGAIAVDRAGGGAAVRRMIAEARRAIADGQPIVIYPEGTRAAVGERRAHQPGVAALYSQLGLPVVPVALNSGLFWGRRGFRKTPGRITLEFLPPIPPGLPRKTFLPQLAEAIDSASDRLAGSMRGGTAVGKAVDSSAVIHRGQGGG
jgi:1-acyl-sn-glycerol-3-phosphate acyltransferase